MEGIDILNLIAACACAFACGWNIKRKDYGWAALDGLLALLNVFVISI